ncbi:heme lyase CcmF/NrfE family subunit [Mesorhizobium sp. LHD-90]|uniref:heme lyase CcmF/NrfE family subunit n=1 Tax=Mesorhizobium sp. LHD-90 TaxID=3071414 RepID=UPI0027E1AE1B|nr:heme lyase CcmF/NrfE family subunit [Mesorhizobium sp. LHD-90]MDQ6436901.1 heme lyase CcmF/NrfE family subunit [Mesorhizobium sp. LHD-90]
MVETGHFALVLALALALVQSLVPLVGARTNDARLMATGGPVAVAGFALTGIAFAALVMAYVQSDFSVANVWENSHSAKPMLYKVTGTWGNHEGSMLLWVLILTFFGALVAVFGGNLPATLRANVLSVQGWIGAAFLLFVLTTSNPFIRLEPAPFEGRDLNPILQDVGLAIHPPLLYLGYVGFSVCFSFAVAALIDGRIDAAWARWVRPWTLAAWMFLTGGIAMGSYWAYYELGWGGFWFWDPVENASFMPWLAGTALLHSAIVMEKRSALKIWTILLAILTFSLSLLGTFLVRSGVLTSVHAFATDPTRGVFILAILVLFIGGSLALFALRAGSLTAGGLFHPISREGALVLNNLFLTTAAATVLVGTLYPLLVEAVTGDKISVGAPFFNLTFGPLMLPLLLLIPFGPLLAWKRGDVYAVAQRLMAAFGGALLAVLATLLLADGASVFAALGVGIGVWMILGALTDLVQKSALGTVPLAVAARRLAGLPRSVHGTALAHLGMGVTVLGIVATLAFEAEHITIMKPGESTAIAGRTLRFEGVSPVQGPNFTETRASFVLLGAGGGKLGEVTSAKRVYTARQMPTTEAGILTLGFSQLYVSLGDPTQDGGIVVRIWWKPLVTLIWLGGLVMMVAAAVSLTDRRLRVGAPARRAKAASSPAGAKA